MSFNRFQDWLISILASGFNNSAMGQKRLAIRVRKDGQTETKPVIDQASARTTLMIVVGVLSIVALLFSLRGRASQVGSVSPTPAVVVC